MEAAPQQNGPKLVRLNAELKDARWAGPSSVEFSYQSTARAIAILDRAVKSVEVDGAAEPFRLTGPKSILLPRGQHVVTITCE